VDAGGEGWDGFVLAVASRGLRECVVAGLVEDDDPVNHWRLVVLGSGGGALDDVFRMGQRKFSSARNWAI
jgi:hypothetical protein